MWKAFIALLLVASMIMADASPALARKSSSGHSSKASGNFIVRKCKTQACNKKHPDGSYAVPLKKKK